MKYMLLAYSNVAESSEHRAKRGAEQDDGQWDNVDVTSQEFLDMCKFYEDLEKELTESGEFVESRGLADPSHSKVVRKSDGAAVATDGPFGEAKEALVSFSILDCESYDRAVEIAARVVNAVGDTVEVRPVMENVADPVE